MTHRNILEITTACLNKKYQIMPNLRMEQQGTVIKLIQNSRPPRTNRLGASWEKKNTEFDLFTLCFLRDGNFFPANTSA